jgi:serine/threonine-protein kinase/endoribonuclease IRE1
LSGGEHAFGNKFDREKNILKAKFDLSKISVNPEVYDLIVWMIDKNPINRPTADEITKHLVFWSDTKKLNYICDLSDRLENEDECMIIILASKLLFNLERRARRHSVLAHCDKNQWSVQVDARLFTDLKHKKKYRYYSITDLVRVIK